MDLLRVEIVVQRVPRIAVDDVWHALEQQGDRLERAGPCGGEGNLAARNQLAGHRIDLCRTRLPVQNPEVAIGVERQAALAIGKAYDFRQLGHTTSARHTCEMLTQPTITDDGVEPVGMAGFR